jgi:hypothetical protein
MKKHFTPRRKEEKNQRRKEATQPFAPSVFRFFAPLREMLCAIAVCAGSTTMISSVFNGEE